MPLRELGQPGVYVAAKLNVFEVGTPRAQLGLAAQAAGAHHRSRRQRVESTIALRDQHIARIGSLGNRRQRELLTQLRGQIFQAMHRQIDGLRQQRVFNLAGEHALGADRGKGDVLHAVAGGADDLDRNLMPQLAQRFCNVIGLPQRELRSPGADADQ